MMPQLTPNQDAVLAELIRAADAGKPCPTNKRLAEICGLVAPESASEAVKRLEAKGLINVTRGTCDRVVEITSTGRSTAGEVARPHWRVDPKREPRRRVQHTATSAERAPIASEFALAARIDADQARLRETRARWLAIEQQRYRLPRRGRMIEEMIA